MSFANYDHESTWFITLIPTVARVTVIDVGADSVTINELAHTAIVLSLAMSRQTCQLTSCDSEGV